MFLGRESLSSLRDWRQSVGGSGGLTTFVDSFAVQKQQGVGSASIGFKNIRQIETGLHFSIRSGDDAYAQDQHAIGWSADP